MTVPGTRNNSKNNMRNNKIVFLLTCCCILWSSKHISAVPYILLTSPAVKCMKLDPTINQEITVDYHCPDLLTIDSSDEKELDSSFSKSDISSRNAEQYKRKLQEAERKGRKMDDIKITISQRLEEANEKRRKSRRNRNRNKQQEEVVPQGTIYLGETIVKPAGTLTFLTSPSDPGIVEICLQSDSAGTGEAAIRFLLDIKIKEYVDLDLAKKEIGKHVSKMEAELKALQSKVKFMLQRSNQDKEGEVEFHDKTITMNKAMRFWPIFHIFVLTMVTGFQANHIIRFFQKKNMVL